MGWTGGREVEEVGLLINVSLMLPELLLCRPATALPLSKIHSQDLLGF